MAFDQKNAGFDEDAQDLIRGRSKRSGHRMAFGLCRAAPRTQEPAAGFILQSHVAANLEPGGLNRFYRKSLLPTANST